MFEVIPPGPADPMFFLKKAAEEDKSPHKVDLGVGVYRDEAGKYQELNVVREAKRRLDTLHLGHDVRPSLGYELTTGDEAFLSLAARVLFGASSEPLKAGRISSVQTISGSGANHLGALLLATSLGRKPRVFVGIPTWSNTIPLFQHVGLEVTTFSYLNSSTRQADLKTCVEVMKDAPHGSIFVIQGCCHNPTGADFTLEQWRELAEEFKALGHIPFIDIAYQGLGDGLDEDAAGVRILADAGVDMLVCQSFSKNFALYGERCGALHIVAKSPDVAANVKDQLRALIRREYSSSPAYGARLVKIILGDEELRREWESELSLMRARLRRNRSSLQRYLTETLKTPGEWDHIVNEKGLFSKLALTPGQCVELVQNHQVYLTADGRINVAGLSERNIVQTARSIDTVVRAS